LGRGRPFRFAYRTSYALPCSVLVLALLLAALLAIRLPRPLGLAS
jgi:hypothetical protein